MEKTKLSNNIQPSTSGTLPGNPDVKFPPQSGRAVPYSKDGKITEWSAMPNGNSIAITQNQEFSFLEIQGDGVVVVKNGKLTIVPTQAGDLSLFNNSLGWTGTTDCS